ncbi:A/G-specific adenine glycosylase [Alteripontixanthobacter maritimus]|uniref:Adenine DNA glycosylase n=1 Tax=Alteripontixanthobacter maritimus TaxID=2161824 RepID=A0A369Q9I9_9SPHN|nr:A/G-specific adenine glycosylase [Alteripontixanthobacter maritimus]RDC59579.1 A/G-specific adenine glycosylase [Alteripontixanthobacter maritimus]
MTASTRRQDIADRLLAWYDEHARDLPWRARPGDAPKDPYRVWLSEVMLQQTTVAAVKPYFAKFTDTWPSVDALAAAPEEDVMAAWAGLGYYSRARNLVKAAREVAGLGGFPDTEEGLRKLPGLGAYTAASVAAIAFGRRAVVVDANVERVVSRLFAIDEPLPGARKAIRAATDTITPDLRSGDFAQAMMDLGATICTARDPKCLLCVLSDSCKARKTGDPARLPVKPPKKARPLRYGTAWWIEQDQRVWLVTRQGTGMLGGMRALPDDGWNAKADGNAQPPLPQEFSPAGSVVHGFTHFTIELDVRATLTAEAPEGEGEWWPIATLDEAGLPTLFEKASARVLANRRGET